ncbi:MAG: AP2/ERF family transcription factor [Clostridia bacterium]|nr:AP2/ERF family transcription factor [Clostridia bacterium]
MLKYPEIQVGDVFGEWEVIEYAGRLGPRMTKHYVCRCSCGTQRVIPRNNLVRGLSRSCGHSFRKPDPWIESEGDHYRYHCSDGGTFIFSPCDLEIAKNRKWITGPNGYAVDDKMNHFSRVVMNAGDDEYVDHISMDIHDERRENLRLCSWSENNCNKILQSNNKTGYKGVSFHKQSGKYMASLWKDRLYYYGGLHTTPEEAAVAYDEMARAVHGEYARLNFPHNGERSCRV